MKTVEHRISTRDWSLPALFLAARLILFSALPPEGLRGYGDLVHYYRLAELGRPFIELWVEYPPVFPWLSYLIYQLSGGREHVFDYLLAIVFTFAQVGSLWLFIQLDRRLHGEVEGGRRSWVYFALLASLAYGWWYFDPLSVFAMLLGLHWILRGKAGKAGGALAIGMLLKWFPGLPLAAAWHRWPARRAAFLTALSLGLVAAVFSGLFTLAPEMTVASLRSQASKGSWETLWALADGNLNTGNFGPLNERFEPAFATQPVGRPPRVPMWATLPIFCVLGGALFWRSRTWRNLDSAGLTTVSFLGLAWCVFLLWLPGYSPQWVLYLLPLVMLALPEREAILASILLVLVNLLEWPLLLSRGLFTSLWLTIPLRASLHLLLAFRFWTGVNGGYRS